MSRGEAILFTCAGFSMAARNISGSGMPSSQGIHSCIDMFCSYSVGWAC